MFCAAVKYAKGVRLQHVRRHGEESREEGRDIYHAAIQKFMKAAKEAKVSGKFNPNHGPGIVNSDVVIEMIKGKAGAQKKEGKVVGKKTRGEEIEKKKLRST